MRILALLALLLPSAALAQGELGALICQNKPTPACVLELALEAAAAAPDDQRLPYDRILGTAARTGNLDLALSLLGKVDGSDVLAKSDLVAGAARADRLPEIEPFLQKLGESLENYAYEVGPVLVEFGRDAALSSFIEGMKTAPGQEQVGMWRVQGHLQAGRAEEALRELDRLPEDQREDIAAVVADQLYFRDTPALARPLVPRLSSETSSMLGRKARLAEALRDPALAESVLAAMQRLPKGDQEFIANDVARALAAGGDWRKALELVGQVPAEERVFVLLQIAAVARQVEMFGPVEEAMRQVAPEVRDRTVRLLVRALILSGLEPVAAHYLDAVSDPYERQIVIGFAAAALAEIGRSSEAVALARALEDAERRSWALWEVASKLRP